MTDTASEFVGSVLASFGLPVSDPLSSFVVSSPQSRVEIGDDTQQSPLPVRIVTSNSLAQIKAWIGNDDEIAARHGIKPHSSVNFTAVTAESANREHLAAAARQYVYGERSVVAHLVPAIEKHLGPFRVHVFDADTITISAGQTLVFEGNDPKVVTANELIFDGPGANIASYVNLSMNIRTVTVK